VELVERMEKFSLREETEKNLYSWNAWLPFMFLFLGKEYTRVQEEERLPNTEAIFMSGGEPVPISTMLTLRAAMHPWQIRGALYGINEFLDYSLPPCLISNFILTLHLSIKKHSTVIRGVAAGHLEQQK
jgi:hypothetical protein